MTATAPTLNERLDAAREVEDKARQRLAKAEPALLAAVDGGEYGLAEQLKIERDTAREEHLIAAAHVSALEAGVQDIEQQRARDRQAQAEYERIEEAKARFGLAQAREAQIHDELQERIAQIDPAYEALRRVMQEAVDADHRLGVVRNEMHQLSKSAGWVDPTMPGPPPANYARTVIDSSLLLSQIFRMPTTH